MGGEESPDCWQKEKVAFIKGAKGGAIIAIRTHGGKGEVSGEEKAPCLEKGGGLKRRGKPRWAVGVEVSPVRWRESSAMGGGTLFASERGI